MCGDYHMTIDPNEKDALLHTPGAGLTQYEQMGLTSKADRIAGIGNSTLGPNSGMDTTKQFDKLEQWALLESGPQGEVQGPGRSRKPQDQCQLDAVRHSDRLRPR